MDTNSQSRKRLTLVLTLTCVYMVVEALGGWWTNSLALLADAAHMFTDVAALCLALAALWICTRRAPPAKTYGYYRTEILAALTNAVMLILIALGIFYEALDRLNRPRPILAWEMFAVATGGLAINLVSYRILKKPSEGSLNLRGALLHVIGDAIGSAGAMAAAVLIAWRKWTMADPLFGVVTGALIILSAWRLLRDSVNVLLEATPAHINISAVEGAIGRIEGVQSVHDLHIWTITPGKEALSAHVVLGEGACQKSTLQSVCTCIQEQFGIDHLTIQTESHDFEEEEMRF